MDHVCHVPSGILDMTLVVAVIVLLGPVANVLNSLAVRLQKPHLGPWTCVDCDRVVTGDLRWCPSCSPEKVRGG